MQSPKAIVIRTAGTNCDEETKFALEHAGAKAELIHINHLAKESNPFGDTKIIAIPGGFTYGDDVASGKVLAVELAHVIGDKLNEFVAKGGLIIGICNGFQVLVKTGLLPDARFSAALERKTTLTFNDSHKFECRWVRLKADSDTVCVFAEGGEEFDMPVAHGEGKFVCRDQSVLDELKANGQIVYRYVGADGSADIDYPEDPNGSVEHIAGICDKSGRIFGMMPHPERHIFAHQHPRARRDENAGKVEGEGIRLFKRAVRYCKES